MKKRSEFPFDRARRVTAEEVTAARSAIAAKWSGARAPLRGAGDGEDKE